MKEREPLTVLIPAGNECDNIRGCLESVNWADDIFVVVDERSDDGTEEICREFTSHIVRHEYRDSASQKNWAIPQATHEWILIVDADERVSPELRREIEALLGALKPDIDGYLIRRRTCFFGKLIRHCGWQRDWVLRLFHRDRCRYDTRRVHSAIELPE